MADKKIFVQMLVEHTKAGPNRSKDIYKNFKNPDLIEKDVDDIQTVFSELTIDNYDGIITSATDPTTSVIDIYNTIVSNEFDKETIEEYIAVRYNPKRMSKIPALVYKFIDLVYFNQKYINRQNGNENENKNTIEYIGESINDIGYTRENGSIGDKILYNEVVLINSRTNVIRISEFFDLPPLYIFNTYFNYFVNFSRLRLTPEEQLKKYSVGDFVKMAFDIFKDGYIESMDYKVPLG
jgi:hypothetical protein